MPGLFDPLTLRGLTLRNRITVSPMCQYSCDDGLANEWHLVHLGTRAVGGAGLVFTEATAITPSGRISPRDLGIWSDRHAQALAPITAFIETQGSIPGIQLAHAGRKASTYPPGAGDGAMTEAEGGWTNISAPSAEKFTEVYPAPHPMDQAEIAALIEAFVAATKRSTAAGFKVIELHAAHGYLLHEFLSPLSNHRTDQWGGSFENRTRLVIDVTRAIRDAWPESHPLVVRISSTDWTEGGWDIEQSVQLARTLSSLGVDMIDCSSGGNVAHARIPLGAGYQTPFAERIRRDAGIMTGAVGLITQPAQADHIIRTGQADMVVMARELLRDPYWPHRAAQTLGVSMEWPEQYIRAAPKGTPSRGWQPPGTPLAP